MAREADVELMKNKTTQKYIPRRRCFELSAGDISFKLPAIVLQWAKTSLIFKEVKSCQDEIGMRSKPRLFPTIFLQRPFLGGDFRVIFTSIFLNFLNEDWYLKTRKPLVSLGF
jgi:hypothetical protein